MKSSIMKIIFENNRNAATGQFVMRKCLSANPAADKWCGLERDPEVAATRKHLKRCEDKLQRERNIAVAVRCNTSGVCVDEVPVLRMNGDGAVEATEHWSARMAGHRWSPSHLPRRL